MSEAPRRPPRPSRPTSCYKDDKDLHSSVTTVDSTDAAVSNNNENGDSASSENVGFHSRVTANCDVLAAEAVTTVEGDDDTDTSAAQSQSYKSIPIPEVEVSDNTEVGVSSPAKTSTPVKHATSTEAKFRCSSKSRKAPPVPPQPSSLPKETPSSADSTAELLPVKGNDGTNGNESRRNVLRDASPCNKCTSAPLSTSANNPDVKPALKPKPVTTTARESISSLEDISSSHSARTSSLHTSSNSEPISTASSGTVAAAPLYAVVNKSRTLRSVSTVDRDAGSGGKPGTNVTVARSKSTVGAGATPPKKPPRTFAHSEYMRLKNSSLPRSSEPSSGSDYEEVGNSVKPHPVTTDNAATTTDDNIDGDCKLQCTQPVTDAKESGIDGGGKARRQQTDKLPAPPRPPPPSFPDNRSTTLSSRSSVTNSDATGTCHSEKCYSKDSRSQRPERSSVVLEDKLKPCARRMSGSDVVDDDDIYAVPGEVTSGGSSDVTTLRSHLTCTTSTASETTQPTLRPV